MDVIMQNTKMIRYGPTGVRPCVLCFLSPGLFQNMVKVLDFYQGKCIYTHTLFYIQFPGPHGSPKVHLRTLR